MGERPNGPDDDNLTSTKFRFYDAITADTALTDLDPVSPGGFFTERKG